jgi:CRP/FNR family transcriptional regulator, cyclic AMP receptor protein
MAHFHPRDGEMRHAIATANTTTGEGITMRTSGMSVQTVTPKGSSVAICIPTYSGRSLLTLIGVRRSSVEYQPKEAVFQQGDIADAVFYIESGTVQIAVLSDQGKEGVVAMLGAGDFFGEGCLAGQDIQLASATAHTAATIMRIEKAAMTRALQEQPAFAERFTAFLLANKLQVEADLVDQLFNSSERRLARLLLLLANFGKAGKAEIVIPKISQESLAARVGTTRSRINFFMNKFRKLGMIEYDGYVKVHASLLNIIDHEARA